MREPVCVEETADGQWQVRYYAMPLGVIDRNANRLTRKKPDKPQTTPPETMLDDTLYVSPIIPVRSVTNHLAGPKPLCGDRRTAQAPLSLRQASARPMWRLRS
jgi:hypothetical protein